MVIAGISWTSCFSQVQPGHNRISIYNYPMDPRQHPDDSRRYVKPPDSSVFGNQIQFTSLRELGDDYNKQLEDYTIKYGLGNIIWPFYPFIYRNDLPEIVQNIKRRGLYLFDIYGYVPGSGPGGVWQAFNIPRQTLNLFSKELGNHWLGMDNGEQDGRYIGGFADQMIPPGSNREQQYLNFQSHFQGLTDRLGSKMTTLVSLNYGHYYLKEGIYSLIGAETGQALPNGQLYYSFIRGAGKQYGIPWFGNASGYNRWGWKNYSGITEYNGGETEGASLSLLKRLMYSHILYDCVAVGFDQAFLNGKGELSPIGEIQQHAVQWVKKFGNPGILYTPVAVMCDFFSGWTFPRHYYMGHAYRVWGNLPYEAGDYLTDDILDMVYPGYRDASYFHDETGFITPTPYGDIVDCILSDSPLWLLQQYPVLVIGNKLSGGYEIKDKLEGYVKSGGHLVITSGSLENIPGGLSGITTGPEIITLGANSNVLYGNTKLNEAQAFDVKELKFPSGTKIVAKCNQTPLAVECSYGSGRITVFASSFGIGRNPVYIPKSHVDSTFKAPFPLLDHVKSILGDILAGTKIFDAGEGLSLITCHKSKGEFTVGVCNNTWQEKPFRITSNAGRIIKITELPLNCSEQKATGYLPKNMVKRTGKNTQNTIKGGDIRIFSVKMDETEDIKEMPYIQPVPNPINRGLALRDISSVKKEILLRPTFFQHFDRIVIDWKYLRDRETSVLEDESGWIKRQGLKLVVDFSSGINLFPDLRLVNNDSLEYPRSMKTIESVIDKMALLGAKDMIITTHRRVENNFTSEQFNESLIQNVKGICRYAAKYDINVNLRRALGRKPSDLEQSINFAESVNEPNFYLSPSTAFLLANRSEFEKNAELLKNLKCRILLVAAPEKDNEGALWNINSPIINLQDKMNLKQLITSNPGCALVLDGIYSNYDEEYSDIKVIEDM